MHLNINIFRKLSIVYLLIIISSCKGKIKEVIIGDNIVIGNVNLIDTSYEGYIQFLNKYTKQIELEAHYLNNKLNGDYKEYYKGGLIKTFANYKEGKLNGNVYMYESSGAIKSKTNFFHGIQVGDQCYYDNGRLKIYSFFSLNSQDLFQLKYDSIGKKGLPEITKEYFYIDKYAINNCLTEFKFYNINPPKYKFDYKIVTVNDENKIIDTIKSFDVSNFQFSYKMENCITQKTNSTFPAIGIFVLDSLNQKDFVMIKKLL